MLRSPVMFHSTLFFLICELKGAETNLYTFRYWLFSKSIQICFRTLYLNIKFSHVSFYSKCVFVAFPRSSDKQDILLFYVFHFQHR